MPESAPPLTLQQLHSAIDGGAAGKASAVRVVTRLVPAEGDGDKIFPPTFKCADRDAATYSFEKRRLDGAEVQAVLLDSVASQANRLEQCLLRAFRLGQCGLPVLSVSVPRHGAPPTCVTALDAPHRVTDAIFRDSNLGGKRFRESDVGSQLVEARPENATALFRFCPTALLFGFWDSQSESGVHGAKFARALASEIVGLNAVCGRGTGSRVDPLAISAGAAKVYRSEKDQWTLDEKEALKGEGKEKSKPVLYGKGTKAGKPSAINHGNVTPSVTAEDEPGGVTISEAVHTAVLSLPQLRRFRFPASDGTTSTERDAAAQTVLAALALYALALQDEDGYWLRSRCHLVPLSAPRAELVGRTAGELTPFSLSAASCRQVLEGACARAKEAGLEWQGGLIELEPTDKLVELVRRSDAKVRAEGGDDAGD